MRRRTKVLTSAIAILSVVFVVVVSGAGTSTDAIPAAKQAKLLEKFSDKGIDADGDGVLTSAEVKAFFAAKHCGDAAEAHGKKKHTCPGKKAGAHSPMKWDKCHGMLKDMGCASLTAEQLAKILKHHPKADTDGDGVLSEAELKAFKAQQMAECRAAILKDHPEADTDKDSKLSAEEMQAFMKSVHGDVGCKGGPGHAKAGHAAHKAKGLAGCGAHKAKGHAAADNPKPEAHSGCSAHKAKDHGSTGDDKPKAHGKCNKAK